MGSRSSSTGSVDAEKDQPDPAVFGCVCVHHMIRPFILALCTFQLSLVFQRSMYYTLSMKYQNITLIRRAFIRAIPVMAGHIVIGLG